MLTTKSGIHNRQLKKKTQSGAPASDAFNQRLENAWIKVKSPLSYKEREPEEEKIERFLNLKKKAHNSKELSV